MANSYTEHSKELRRRTAAKHRKMQIEQGIIKTFNLTLKTELYERFESIKKAEGMSRPQLIAYLCDLYETARNEQKTSD